MDGQYSSKAIFLSWDGKETVFTVRCDRHSKEIVIKYSIPKNVSFDPARPLAIGEVDFRTTKTGQNLEGRSQLTSPLKSQLSARAELEIQAPNEMGEPWYVGIGEPLRRVALACH
ncbi:hypothetical protein EUV02_15410 [Polymorphobacter arshaanensis]|uniref:Uncharacterized protein n=1 Tax=Glacieibacterium arshaanense TaxID=2511025 RepID=A0A4Y9EKA0_9SPHN|nr:hypothetical protein [Polymorphobacter arshaanensis]TFU00431.1 hypothetical protein EUV02_15410 [Polymorphobacter arshaanensis]